MFEEIHELGDAAAGQLAQNGFETNQNTELAKQRDQLFDETVAGVRDENLALLDRLAEIGEQLRIPNIVSDLTEGIRSISRFQDAEARLDAFAWMPHAPANVRSDLSVADGVRAIRG